MLHELFHHRWSVPIIAELHARRGCRFAELVGRLGISRDVLSQTLEWLVVHRYAEHNPGYGHPMRPEYLPTAETTRIGPACAAVMREIRVLNGEEVLLRRWSCPVVDVLRPRPARFSQLRSALPGVTPRALSLALQSLEEAGLLTRTVGEERPPRVTYALVPRAVRLGVALRGLK